LRVRNKEFQMLMNTVKVLLGLVSFSHVTANQVVDVPIVKHWQVDSEGPSYFERANRELNRLQEREPSDSDRIVNAKIELMDDYVNVVDIKVGPQAKLARLIPDTTQDEISLIHKDCFFCLARKSGKWEPRNQALENSNTTVEATYFFSFH